ncbi:2'-5' RNA ligase [Mycobacterium sp. E136]|uniref:2'-5' RNA ligase family protein n=1 Tax=Mycobacterium sp. E136 TaxID=1834125 RepID=UPI0008013883|nr:2'-5' RNA ligase family protein [Mycobacterium sp. E136]OBG98033.1 2'-5' RNA ligase [Mycobacterium sp. E136]
MALAVCLLFDRLSERAVRGLWDRLEDVGVPSLRSHTHGRHLPHLSYAVLRQWGDEAVADALAGLDDGGPVELTFDGIGLFRRGRVWLVAGVSTDLVARQQRVAEAVAATGADLHKHYRPGVWVPHCSLAPRATLDQLPTVAGTVMDVLPLRARFDHAALIDSGTGEVTALAALP